MKIVIPGDPIANMRPRHKLVKGNMWTYDPQVMEKTHTRILISRECKNYEPENKPCKVDLIFHMDAQKGASKAETNVRLWGYSLPLKKDLDNLEKFVLDCGNGILWSDDRYIAQLSSRKLYSNNPCTIINIAPITEVKMSDAHVNVFGTFSPQDFETMATDAERIFMAIPAFRLDNSLFESQMAAAAELLIDFADEWCPKLKKIKSK